MGKRRSMARNQNHNGVAPWSDLNDDVLLLVVMQLGVVDFLAFSGVCKSWRSFALSNIVSRPPMSMSISISTDANNEKLECWYLEDFDGRKLKTTLRHFPGRTCIGVTCGYLILYGEKTRDFWLVNPIKMHELYFYFPFVHMFCSRFRGGILVFSHLISKWVFVLFNRHLIVNTIWFCIVGEREWTYVETLSCIYDLLAIKGKIYVLCEGAGAQYQLREVTLFPTPKVTLLKIKNVPNPKSFECPVLVTSGENNLYVMDLSSKYPYNIQEINLCKMEWVPLEKLGKEYKFFFTQEVVRGAVTVAQAELWADLYSQYKGKKDSFFYAKMWYFFDHRLNLDLLHE